MSSTPITCIDLFLASSELCEDRLELGNYIRVINDSLLDKGIYFRLHLCRDRTDGLLRTRLPSEEATIRSSRYCFVICGQKAGEDTIREFNIALQQFRRTGTPKIMTFFHTSEHPETSVSNFKERLSREVQHYYTEFNHIDTVKMKILMVLSRDADTLCTVELRDGTLYLDGRALDGVDLQHVPCYAMHSTIQALTRQIHKLEERESETQRKLSKSPGKASLLKRLHDIQDQKQQAKEQLHNAEQALLDASSGLVELMNGDVVTERMKEAVSLFDQGRPEEAIRHLNNEDRVREGDHARANLEQGRRQLAALCREALTKIDILRSQAVTEASAQAITLLYREVEGYIETGDLDWSPLYDFSMFLQDQHRPEEALQVSRALYDHLKSQAHPDRSLLARAAQQLSISLMMNHDRNLQQKAPDYFMEALELYDVLAKEDPQRYAADLIRSNLNLNIACCHPDACGEYSIVFGQKIRERILTLRAQCVNDHVQTDLIASQIQVDLHLSQILPVPDQPERIREAESLCDEAVSLSRQLCAQNPEKQEELWLLSAALMDRASSALEADDWNKALEATSEASDIAWSLCQNNFRSYQNVLKSSGMTLCRIADRLHETHHSEEAIPLLEQSIRSFRLLCERAPEQYTSPLRNMLNDLAHIYFDTGHPDLTVPLLEETLTLFSWDESAEVRDQIADTLDMAARIYLKLGRFRKWAQHLTEARKAYLLLEREFPGKYQKKVTELDLAVSSPQYRSIQKLRHK